MEEQNVIKDVKGVECPVCKNEVFRLIPRTIDIVSDLSVEIKCCPVCVKKIDAGEEKKLEEVFAKETDKVKGRQAFQERAHQWARSLHGKKVIVFWDRDVAQVFSDPSSQYHAQGVAYITKNACGGWAQIKVILDQEENKRVQKTCLEVGYCSVAQRNMYYVSPSFTCDRTECQEQEPTMDGIRFSRVVYPVGDGRWYIPITWGGRKSVIEY